MQMSKSYIPPQLALRNDYCTGKPKFVGSVIIIIIIFILSHQINSTCNNCYGIWGNHQKRPMSIPVGKSAHAVQLCNVITLLKEGYYESKGHFKM